MGFAAALMTTVDCGFTDVELADPDRFVGSLPAEFGAVCGLPCGASGVGAAAVAAGVTGVAAFRATGDGIGSTEGAAAAVCSVGDAAAGAAVATAEGTPVRVGVASADAVVSLLDGGKLVCGRPERCPTPGRGPAVEVSLGEEVELVWSTGLCTLPEADEEPAAEADEFVLDGAPVDDGDDGPAADSDAGREAGDDEPGDELEEDESDDELEELLSCGSANATAGVFATAAPTPSANANAPARTMYCAFTGIALGGPPGWAPAERPPEPP